MTKHGISKVESDHKNAESQNSMFLPLSNSAFCFLMPAVIWSARELRLPLSQKYETPILGQRPQHFFNSFFQS
jgi:hypothetical protein